MTNSNEKNIIEYKMSYTLAKDLLSNRVGEDIKMNPKDYLIKVVNENFGLKGICVSVIID